MIVASVLVGGFVLSKANGQQTAFPGIRIPTNIDVARDTRVEVYINLGHGAAVRDVAISPNGRYVATASNDGTVKIWDFATGRLTRTLTAHSGPVHAVTIIPHRRMVVSGGADAIIHVWDPISGQQVRALVGHQGVITALSVDPTGRWLVSAGMDGTVRVWELPLGQIVRVIHAHARGVIDVAVSPNGQYIVSGGVGPAVKVWHLRTGRLVRTLRERVPPMRSSRRNRSDVLRITWKDTMWPIPGERRYITVPGLSSVECVTVSPDNRYVLACTGGQIHAWRLATGEPVARFTARYVSAGYSVAVTPDTRYVVAGGREAIVVWRFTPPEEPLYIWKVHDSIAYAVAVDASSRYVVTGSGALYGARGRVAIWDLWSGRKIRTLGAPQREIWAVAVSPDDRYVLSGGGDSMIKVWDRISGRLAWNLTSSFSETITAVAVHPSGHVVISGSNWGAVRIWAFTEPRRVRILQGQLAVPVTAVAISADDRYVVAGDQDGRIYIRDLASGRLIRTLQGHARAVSGLAITPDGQWIVSGSEDGTVYVWALPSGRWVRMLPAPVDHVHTLITSPDGRYVFVGGTDFHMRTRFGKIGVISAWDLNTGQQVWTFATGPSYPLPSYPLALAISADGTWLVVGNANGTIGVWPLFSDDPLWIRKGHPSTVQSVAVSPDGRYVISSALDDGVKVWERATGRLIHTLRGVYGVSVTVSPDSRYVIAGGMKSVVMWELSTGRRFQTLEHPWHDIHALALSSDGHWVVTGGEDGTIRVWEPDTWGWMRMLTRVHRSVVRHIRISPDGSYFVSSGSEGTIRMWDGVTYEPTWRLFGGKSDRILPLLALAISPNGRYLIVALPPRSPEDAHHRVIVVDLFMRIIRHLPEDIQKDVLAVEMNTSWRDTQFAAPDGSIVRVWNYVTGRPVRELHGHLAPVRSVRMSRDGQYVISGAQDKTIRIWKIPSGQPHQILRGHLSDVTALAIGMDNTYLVSGSLDGTVRLWDLSTGRELARMVQFVDESWIVLTPQGYVNASPDALRHVNVRIGARVFELAKCPDLQRVIVAPDRVRAVLRGEQVSPVLIRGKHVQRSIPCK